VLSTTASTVLSVATIAPPSDQPLLSENNPISAHYPKVGLGT
jgi:hypothetical protein